MRIIQFLETINNVRIIAGETLVILDELAMFPMDFEKFHKIFF